MIAARRPTRVVRIGGIPIGGGHPIVVQTMANAPTADVERTVAQVGRLAAAGAAIVRLGIPDATAAEAVAAIRRRVAVPLVADIHFDHRLALTCLTGGVDALRINPGNMGNETHVSAVLAAARDRGVPIRIGVNGGSLPKDLMERFGGATPEAMCEAALREVAIFERHGFAHFKVSIKSSHVLDTIRANELFSARCDAPLHLGVTEAGIPATGLVRSGLGIGRLLALGIGDTIRVSLTADPEREIGAGYALLAALGLPAFEAPRCRIAT